MRLYTKTILATSCLTAISALSVGAAALAITFQSGLSILESQLEKNIDLINANQTDPISEALLLGSTQEITIGFREADGTITALQESAGSFDSPSLISRELDLGADQVLVLALSTARLQQGTLDSVFPLLGISLSAAILSGLIASSVLRSDLRLIRELASKARAISQGSGDLVSGKSASKELIELSESLNQMVERLKSANASMQDFLSDASHELRTPLTVIRGYLELLAGTEVTQEQRERSIERSISEAKRMQELINDILLLAELGYSKEIEFEEIDLNELIEEQILDLRNLQPLRPISYVSNYQANYLGSRKLINQLLANAFSNLRNHTASQTAVEVSLSQKNELLELDIADAGSGIPELATSQEVTAFKRFDRSRSRSTGGSGLGLSIMAKIAQVHGGELVLGKSRLGGLSVKVTLSQRSPGKR